MTFGRIGIVGAGHIGGSIARALGAASVADVFVFDTSRSARDDAAAAGLVVARSIGDLTEQSDILILATPMPQYRNVLSEIQQRLDGEASQRLILDVGSVQGVLHALAPESPSLRFIGTHPMAGTELQGFSASRLDLFAGATWAITPPPATLDSDLVRAMSIVEACGAHPLVLDVATHDHVVALVSHFPHVISALIANSIRGPVQELAISLAAGSFRDITRVTESAPAFTTNLCVSNRAEIQGLIDRAVGELLRLRATLKLNDQGVFGHFESAREVRQRLMSREAEVLLHTFPRVTDRGLAPALQQICQDGSRIDSCELVANEYRIRALSIADRHQDTVG